MARQEKALDPTAGPLQSFAYELRKIRIEAGSPTYRALAKSAGYSAATLSEAAGGVRRPTLEVVLAYVGACRGDVDHWRRRWQELQEALASSDTPGDPPAPAGVDREAPAPAPGAVGAAGLRWRWQARPVVAVVGVCVFVAVAAAAVAVSRSGHTARTTSPGCPQPPTSPAFKAETYGAGARARTGATRAAPVAYTIPSGCTVGFVGLCIGEKMHDNTGGSPDVRWFKLRDGNVVFSGIVHGNPPPALRPTTCADSQPAPEAVALTVAADPGQPATVRLSAAGRHLAIVGFAALYQPVAEQSQPRRWRQIALTEGDVDQSGFTALWRIGQQTVLWGGEPVVLVAAACLGGDGPTGVLDAVAIRSADLAAPTPWTTLSDEDRTAATTAACQYPA